jgi:hypothetical protein
MEGLFFLLSIIGVGLLMLWVVKHDSAEMSNPTAGVFAMR